MKVEGRALSSWVRVEQEMLDAELFLLWSYFLSGVVLHVVLDVLQGKEKIPPLLWTSARTQTWLSVAGPWVASLGKVGTVLILSSWVWIVFVISSQSRNSSVWMHKCWPECPWCFLFLAFLPNWARLGYMTCWDQGTVCENNLCRVKAEEAWLTMCSLGRECLRKGLFYQPGSQNEGALSGRKGVCNVCGLHSWHIERRNAISSAR